MWYGVHWYGLYAAPMDFVLVVRGYIDVAARVWLEVGWGVDLHLRIKRRQDSTIR